MYLAVEFEYSGGWETIPEEDYASLREVIPSLPAEKPKYGPYGTHFITDETIPLLARHKLCFRPSNEPESQGLGCMLVKLQDRIKALELRESEIGTAGLYERGAAVQISIPDFALLAINEVTWLDDACTEDLQRMLNEGWRILAVCPPNAQRRPDYILGRRKP